MVKQGLSAAQKSRLASLRKCGAELYSFVPPPEVHCSPDDMVCVDEGKFLRQFVLVSPNGAVLRRVTVQKEVVR